MELNLMEKQTGNQWRAERTSRGWLQQHRSRSEEQKGKQSCRKAIELEILVAQKEIFNIELKHKTAEVWRGGQEVDIKTENIEVTILPLARIPVRMYIPTWENGWKCDCQTKQAFKKKNSKTGNSPLFWLLKVWGSYTSLIALCLTTIRYVNNTSHKELIIHKQWC